MKIGIVFICVALIILVSCSINDDIEPVISPVGDASIHYRGDPYDDPGAYASDNHTCNLNYQIETDNNVDTSRYGSYEVIYTVSDDAGNTGEEIRNVDIVLPLDDYYDLEYHAVDSCTTGNYFYTGFIQDCDCPDFSVTVGNISNFGQSALFTLPVSGTYNEILLLDTLKAGVYFEGIGTMSPGADLIIWQYSISDSIDTDVCTSTWIRE